MVMDTNNQQQQNKDNRKILSSSFIILRMVNMRHRINSESRGSGWTLDRNDELISADGWTRVIGNEVHSMINSARPLLSYQSLLASLDNRQPSDPHFCICDTASAEDPNHTC